MSNAATYIPAFKFGHRVYPRNLFNEGGGLLTKEGGMHWFVDGDVSSSGNGDSVEGAFKTIAEAITASQAYDVVHIFPKQIVNYTGDPTSYTENLVIPFAKAGLAIVGEGRGRTQGGLPQIKVGTTTTDPILKIQAPGCLLQGLGINGVGATGGGILLDDDFSTKSAFGTTIEGCHFKNCVGPDADDAKDGGAIQWPSVGNAWQVSILNNRFYKNVADITMLGNSTNTRPQDVLIQGNVFSGYPAHTDCNIYGAGGGFGHINIDSNLFGALPAIGANIARYLELTGTLSGMISNNVFGCLGNSTATELTFKADGTGAKFPTTVMFANNWGVSANAGEQAYHSIA